MILSLAIATFYLGLLVFAFQHSFRRTTPGRRLIVFCSYSAALMGLHALILGERIPSSALSSQALVVGGMSVGAAFITSLTLAYLGYQKIKAWRAVPIALWIIAVVVAEMFQIEPWLISRYQLSIMSGLQMTLGREIMVLGWLAISAALVGIAIYAYLKEPLPLYANRILYWIFVLPTLLVGEILSSWLHSPWHYVGYGIKLIGTLGAVYGILAYRVFNLREVVRWLFRRLILALATGLLALSGILIVIYFPSPIPEPYERVLLAIGVSALLAIIYQPVYEQLARLTRHIVMGNAIDPAESVRLYAQKISGVIDLQELSEAAIRTLNYLMSTRHGYLIVATPSRNKIALEVISENRIGETRMTHLAPSSPIYERLKTSSYPLLQYDIDYHRDFLAAPESERRYFDSLEVDIYAPIVSDGRLVGLLALGPKANDDPFRPQEMELLAAIAHQTVVALENARLVNDLRGLNEKVNALNEEMRATNQRIERLDSVKTDFITIASHELRTPLTQIQGYADLMYEMFQHGSLTHDELEDMINRLTMACGRMTEVVTAMLDVAQIDIDVMDLDFEEVSLVGILKQAVEPYSEAIQARKLNLVSQGLRKLPPIYGDGKRLVQAFENLITNAIKYTPDGGKITITGHVLGFDTMGAPQSIQIIITDTGIGIDEANQQLIFDKFFRVDPVELHSTGATKFRGGGAGLGLSIVKGIIEGHGGRAWAESRGHDEERLPGSHFHVVLPIRPPAMDLPEDLFKLQNIEPGVEGIFGSRPFSAE
ncbi:MAG: GAF domain-containing sensor histidine kinase [Anaerolineae bacterium]|nr:GAF domain-containing sensor histidine kinase [Anaerolineae bacterium]